MPLLQTQTLSRPLRSPSLARHIVVVLLVKTVLLIGLWHFFVKPNRVSVGAEQAGGHIVVANQHTNSGE